MFRSGDFCSIGVLFKINKSILKENPLRPDVHTDQAVCGLGAMLSLGTCVILRHGSLSVKDKVYQTEFAQLAKRLSFLSLVSRSPTACPCFPAWPGRVGRSLPLVAVLSEANWPSSFRRPECRHALSHGGRLDQQEFQTSASHGSVIRTESTAEN